MKSSRYCTVTGSIEAIKGRVKKITASRNGFTLLEAVIALGIWFILSAAVLFAWQYSANTSTRLITRNHAFENARFAMDAMLVHIQHYDDIRITTHTHGATNDVLRTMEIRNVATFAFDATLPVGHERRGRIERSTGANELARHIGLVQVIYTPQTRIDIIIKTDCEQPVILTGSACVRYKRVVLTRR
jgi:hypothetical protein